MRALVDTICMWKMFCNSMQSMYKCGMCIVPQDAARLLNAKTSGSFRGEKDAIFEMCFVFTPDDIKRHCLLILLLKSSSNDVLCQEKTDRGPVCHHARRIGYLNQVSNHSPIVEDRTPLTGWNGASRSGTGQ